MSIMFRSACSRLCSTSACPRPTISKFSPPSTSFRRMPAIQAAAATFFTIPQEQQDVDQRPSQQGYYYISSDSNWVESTPGQKEIPKDESQPPLHPRKIRLISWNMDAFNPFKEERMSAALDYLQKLVLSIAPDSATVIFFQEMGLSHMEQIQDSSWVKQRFNLTEIDSQNWLSSHYGTTTLVDRRLHIDSVFRCPWYSGMDRDGLFVDIGLYNHTDPNATPKVMRLCNTHLESLAAGSPVRSFQMAAARKHLSQRNVSCAILAGDLNAIQPFDRKLHSDNGLSDAYLQIGGKEGAPGEEDSDQGYTWGYQGRSRRFGYCRMDKILYTGPLSPVKFQRIGMGVRVAKEHRQMVRKVAKIDWVSDHYGVMCDFVLSSDEQLTNSKQHEE